MNTYVAIA